jgi:hypothetical protein
LQNFATVTLATATATSTAGQQAIATFTAQTAGTYYARISGDRFQDYTLLVTRDSVFDLDNNDSTATAQPVGSASNVMGYSDSDDDWYSVQIPAGNTIQIATSTPGGPDDTFDPTLELYDPSGNLVATDDAIITAKATISGDYRIHLSGSGSGEYLLALTRFWSLPTTSGDDQIVVRENPQSHNTEIFLNTALSDPPTYSLAPNLLNILGLNSRGGNDELTIDGAALVLAPLASSTSLDLTLRNAAQLSFQGSPKLARLNLEDTSRAALSGRNVLRLSQIEISPDARLDLQDGSLILEADEGSRQAMLNLITDRIRSARGNGSWTGPGILTSALAADRLFTLGIMLNSNNGNPVKSVFAGQSVDANSILVGYTLTGDSDLDGDIDSDDYAHIDSSFASHLANPTFADGDFNYSGSINADDYFAIDRAFASQL